MFSELNDKTMTFSDYSTSVFSDIDVVGKLNN
jgi:hypothetical protein